MTMVGACLSLTLGSTKENAFVCCICYVCIEHAPTAAAVAKTTSAITLKLYSRYDASAKWRSKINLCCLYLNQTRQTCFQFVDD